MNPLVSIIIPVFNGANYMREAIDSALAQTYENVEIIVVNDGSDDNGKTREIALSYGGKIRYFEKENGGVSTALNLGIREMQGEFFSWLSHDDVYYPHKIEYEIEALKASGNMEQAVYSGWAALEMPERRIVPNLKIKRRYSRRIAESGLCAVTMGFISGCSLLIPRSYFEKYGLFDEMLRTTQDYAKWFEMFHDKKMIYVDEVLILSRVHAQQVSNKCSSFLLECDELHLWMAKNIKEEDTQLAVGVDKYHFLGAFLARLLCDGLIKAHDYVYWQLKQISKNYINHSTNSFCTWVQSFGGNGVYIYCAGMRGRSAIEALRLRGVEVQGISDSNRELWGTEVYGVKCVPPKQLPKDVLIIISLAEPERLREKLNNDGFKYVITYEQIQERLLEEAVSGL